MSQLPVNRTILENSADDPTEGYNSGKSCSMEIAVKLALYAHYSERATVDLYVLFYLRKLRELSFQICFVSNSPIPQSKEQELREICERVIQRDNSGYDFGMWQQALAEFSLDQIDELLLTNSSIIGPLHPLEPLWKRETLSGCDFWGLTDNDEYGNHVQSYFLVLRRQVLEHPCFPQFWRSVLPYANRQMVIQCYEVGLTSWLQQHGFRWKVIFLQEDFVCQWLSARPVTEKLKDRIRPAQLPKNTPMRLPDLLLEAGMPFLKAKLLKGGGISRQQIDPAFAMRLLEKSNLPSDLLEELRKAAYGG